VQTAVPPSEINNATTYTSDLTVQGAFTSQGIDDNATSTAMTLDSSGFLLVGVQSTTNRDTTAGIYLGSSVIQSNRSGAATGDFGRLSSDGDVVVFRKDGTTVGSIGSAGSGTEMYIGSSGTNKNGIYFTNSNWLAPMQNLAVSDNTQNIGHPSYRWKDLYLSGGVYLGGTGSANYLDDYEEGTWTPILAYVLGGTREYTPSSANVGRYTKIGNAVYITATVAWSGNNGGSTSSYVAVKGLPFTTTSTSDLRMSGSMGGTAGLTMPSGYTNGFAIGADPNNSHVYVMARSTSAYSHSPLISASGALYGFSMTYLTDA
jgi:hypothetical protein